MTRYEDLFKHLQSSGFEVYPPASKFGECKSAYLVVKNSGGIKLSGTSTYEDVYTILIFVPRNKYSEVEKMFSKLKEEMKRIYPLFRPTMNHSTTYYDEEVKAHTMSVDYVNYKKS